MDNNIVLVDTSFARASVEDQCTVFDQLYQNPLHDDPCGDESDEDEAAGAQYPEDAPLPRTEPQPVDDENKRATDPVDGYGVMNRIVHQARSVDNWVIDVDDVEYRMEDDFRESPDEDGEVRRSLLFMTDSS